MNGLSNQGLEKLFTYSKIIYTDNTRSASKMNLHSNQYYYKSFSSIGIITVWNNHDNIPVELRSANSLSKFKQCLFSYYIVSTKLMYMYVYCNCKQFDFQKLVFYICNPLNRRIYHYLFYKMC